ncbi:MAG: N-acetyltransferase [Actinobacteria bacterium]|nr:N-acetyltransferase [Actinomycetota bacterium]
MTIRPERPEDFDDIRHVLKLAFGRVNEADLVEGVRASDHYVPELALVAEDAGQIVGYVLASYVELAGSRSWAVLALAPLGIRPDCQGEGVGVALVEALLQQADAMGEPLVVVLGPPRYYTRFGFEPARPHGIEAPPPGVPDEVFMVKLLTNYAVNQRGQIAFPPAFDNA